MLPFYIHMCFTEWAGRVMGTLRLSGGSGFILKNWTHSSHIRARTQIRIYKYTLHTVFCMLLLLVKVHIQFTDSNTLHALETSSYWYSLHRIRESLWLLNLWDSCDPATFNSSYLSVMPHLATLRTFSV